MLYTWNQCNIIIQQYFNTNVYSILILKIWLNMNPTTLKKKKKKECRDLSALENNAKIHNHGHFKLLSELLLCWVPQFLICKMKVQSK